MIIRRTEPIKAILFMEAIGEKTRQEIIKLLLRKGEMSLTEIQKEIGKVPSTVHFHLNILVKAGILSWKIVKRNRRPTKVYYISDKLFSVEVDIETFSKVSNLEMIRDYVKKLISKYLEAGIEFPRVPKVNDIIKLLNVDHQIATGIRDYIEVMDDEVTNILKELLGDKVEELKKDPIEAAKTLKLNIYWMMKLLKEFKLI